MREEPELEIVTDRRVTISRDEDGHYSASEEGTGRVLDGAIFNFGGRAAAFPPATEIELGGGETEIVIRNYEDSRADDGWLLAVGFRADAEAVL